MAGRLLKVADLHPGDKVKWRQLARVASEPNPFYEPELVIPAFTHLGDDDLQLLVLDGPDGWDACLPIVRRPWRQRVPAWIAWNGPQTFLCTPLVRVGAPHTAVRDMLDGLVPHMKRHLVMLERVGADGDIGATLEAGNLNTRWRSITGVKVQRALLKRREDGDYFAHLKSHHLRESNRQRRRLEEATGGPVQVSDRAGDETAVEDFLQLEMDSWKGKAGTALGSTPGEAQFFRDVCSALAGDGRLQLLELRSGGSIVAMKCNFLAGDGAFAFKIARAQRFAKFSPGIMLEIENVRRFHDSSLRWMDSCADPDNEMINRLWPERRTLITTGFASRGISSLLVRGAFAAGIRIRKRRRPEWLST